MSSGLRPSRELQELAKRLAAEPDVAFASVFGSVARGTARPDSDIDVGVLLDAPLGSARRRELVEALAQVTGRPVDLVDLREAGPELLLSALRGERLIGRG
ncbi:MAG: type VII toxin-antitoxin system MntA family adenylyltransferase antitoxin, partial [Rhodanobacteraceae bacterium]